MQIYVSSTEYIVDLISRKLKSFSQRAGVSVPKKECYAEKCVTAGVALEMYLENAKGHYTFSLDNLKVQIERGLLKTQLGRTIYPSEYRY